MIPQAMCVTRIFEEFTPFNCVFRKQFSEMIIYYNNLEEIPCEEML